MYAPSWGFQQEEEYKGKFGMGKCGANRSLSANSASAECNRKGWAVRLWLLPSRALQTHMHILLVPEPLRLPPMDTCHGEAILSFPPQNLELTALPLVQHAYSPSRE